MIVFKNITKTFGKTTALANIDIQISKGDFVFITGVSGSGKTTLLKIITKDLSPTKGKILINQQNLNKLKKFNIHLLRRTIGVVFQDFKLLPDRTVYENVAIAMRITGKDIHTIPKQVNKTLKLVGLENKVNLFPLQLAGGELQRVCLARAVVTQPAILLADEPTGNLDPITSWQIMELVKQINQSGTTVVMATHNTDIVSSMGKRTIHLDKGKITEELKEKMQKTTA